MNYYKQVYEDIYQNNPNYNSHKLFEKRWAQMRPFFERVTDRGSYTVIDVGAGDGNYLRKIRELGFKVQAIEVSQTCCDVHLRDIPHGCMSILDIPQDCKTVDILLSMGVMEHFRARDIDKVLENQARLAPVALYGIANHRDVQLGHTLHKIRATLPEWLKRLQKFYADVDVFLEDGEKFFFIECRR